MFNKSNLYKLLLAVVFSFPLAAQSQDDNPLGDVILDGLTAFDGLKLSTKEIIGQLNEALESPETQSKLLNAYIKSNSGWQFLQDVDFEIKVFEQSETADSALGFTYDYDKSLVSHELPCGSCVMGLDLSFSAKGNVAFDEETNPNDFLESSFQFDLFRSSGGEPRTDSDLVLQYDQQFGAANTEEEEDAIVQELIRLVRPSLTDQIYFELGGHATLESNQRFTTKQYTYGVHTVFEYKSWSDNSAFSKFNFFDYPVALLRMFSGYDDCSEDYGNCFKPRGSAFPTVLVGYSRVKPQDMDPRTLAGDSSDFDRAKFEVSYKSPLARVGGRRIFLSANYRYYKEIGASSLIEMADLDAYKFYTITLGGDDGLFVSYTDGKLPLDFEGDQIFELGYQFHF